MSKDNMIEKSVVYEALKFPTTPCTHDMIGDEDICDGCSYTWEKSVAALREKVKP